MSKIRPYYYNAPEEAIKTSKWLRRKQTPAEELLWKNLRRKALKGFKFRRQHPIGFYVADFYCHSAKLVIELDGAIHNKGNIKEHDQNRTAVIEDFDITVIRFNNDAIFDDIENVMKNIESYLQ